jgi:hypothetical protein
MKEVGLIFGAVCGFVKLDATRSFDTTRVVTRRKTRTAETTNVLEAHAELDLSIAKYIGIRRSTGAVLRQKIIEHPLPVFRCEVDPVKGNTQFATDSQGVLVISRDRAVGVVFFPVGHEQAFDLESLLPQQQRGNSRIDPARKSDDDHLVLPPIS